MRAVFTAGYRSKIWDEHEGIIDAIEAREPERAARLASEHIANASRVALKNLEALNSKGPHPIIDVDLNASVAGSRTPGARSGPTREI
jgi:hypothetical protein